MTIYTASFTAYGEEYWAWSEVEYSNTLSFRVSGNPSIAIVRDSGGEREYELSGSSGYKSFDFKPRSNKFSVKVGSEPWIDFDLGDIITTSSINEQEDPDDGIILGHSSNPILNYWYVVGEVKAYV